MNKEIRAKKHRLPLAAYRGEKAVSFTACVERRQRAFVLPEVVEPNRELLMEASQKHGCAVLIYCFMPDHLHAILKGTSPSANAKTAMDAFKYQSGLWFSRYVPTWTWQTDYYDHIIRRSEDLAHQICYVAENPVRAKIVEGILEYPFTGSGVGDLYEILLNLQFDRKFGYSR